MMKKTDNFSKTIKVGRVASLSDIRTDMNSGRQLIKFTLAINKDKDKPDYYPCIAYNTTCRYVERYIHAGDKILITGTDCISFKKASNGMQYKSVQVEADTVLLYDSEEAVAILNAMQNVFSYAGGINFI